MECSLHNKLVVSIALNLMNSLTHHSNSEFASWSLETACRELEENGFTILEAKRSIPFPTLFMILALSSTT